MSSTASATSASTVRPSFDTSANPPSTTILCVPLPACTVRMPGRNVVTIGAWSARTPKSPSVPGTSTCCTSPENKSFCGDTNSKRKLAIVSLSPALADGEAHTKSDHAANHGQDRDVLDLLTGKRSAARSLVVTDLNAQRPQFDLGCLFGARHVTGQPTNYEPDQQKRNEVGPPLHAPSRPPRPRAFCPSQPPLRWVLPCRKQLPAGYHICLRRVP